MAECGIVGGNGWMVVDGGSVGAFQQGEEAFGRATLGGLQGGEVEHHAVGVGESG